jgi:hypothetical protein
MTRPASGNPKTVSKAVLKNPLRASTMSLLAPAAAVCGESAGPGCIAEQAAPEVTAQQLRRMQISEFSVWLGTQTSKHKRPFQEETIRGYAETARALDRWMDGEEIDGDFTACGVQVLNAFFAAYRNAHSQGGTSTRQRNLHHLFKWLALRYEHPDPWTGDIVRYGPVKSRPSTLAEGFIRDLLEVTGGGRATSFAEIRDHAMIRMLTEGVRREELAQQWISTLTASAASSRKEAVRTLGDLPVVAAGCCATPPPGTSPHSAPGPGLPGSPGSPSGSPPAASRSGCATSTPAAPTPTSPPNSTSAS